MTNAGAPASTAPAPRARRTLLAGIVAVALAVHLWGIRRDLPYLPETDEPFLVNPTIWMASAWSGNPEWFDHPASTLIYPLAVMNHLWNAAAYGGPLLHPDPKLPDHHGEDPGPNYLMGRLLAVAYAIATVPAVYLLGTATFGPGTGLLASWFSILSPLAIDHAQMARSDSAGAFFGVLALWLLCRLLDRPTLRGQLLAGAAIGLGLSSRYFMVALVPVLLAVDLVLLWRDGRRTWWAGAAGLAAVALTFAASSPYALLDSATALRNIRAQAHTVHPGADGLSQLGNLLFYLGDAIPGALTIPLALAAVAGVALALRRGGKPLLLLLFTAVYLAGICLSAIHWARWAIPVLPVAAVLAASVVTALGRPRLALLFGVLLSIWPTIAVGRYVLQNTGPSTRLRTRAWVLQELPAGTHVAAEWPFAMAFRGTSYDVEQRFSLAERPLDQYRAQGRRIVILSSDIYWRFLIAPQRYPREVAFYRALFDKERLLVEIAPSATSRGPTVRIYELRA